MAARARIGIAPLIVAIAISGEACTCSKGSDSAAPDAGGAAESGALDDTAAARAAGEPGGLSAPIAAARGADGDIIVAGLDVPAKAIRVQRISAKDEILADRTVLAGVAWSNESELKAVPAAGGVALTWRGLRGGKLVRQLLVLGPDLAPKGEPVEVAAASCATHDAIWFSDGKRVHARPWTGPATHRDLPKDKEASLVCAAHRAFALLDEDDTTSVLAFGGGDGGAGDAGTVSLLEEKAFGEDEQRERAEYTVGDDLGVVRLGTSGALVLREVRAGVLGALRTLKTKIPRDDDVVVVDASPRSVVVVFTEDVGEACPKAGPTNVSTRVKALRVDRATFEESVIELSPGTCGREVGPFFTGAIADAVSVGWLERVPVAGKPRAPIAGLAYRSVPPAGPVGELRHVEQPADALVDAGCDATRCYAVALARRSGMDAMVPGVARVIRY